MSAPLTDSINALTAYANETTGASDTTLSDAVGRLIAGFGGAGFLQEISIPAGHYKVADFYNLCQNAVGEGVYSWIVFCDYPKVHGIFLGAQGSAYASHSSVFICNTASAYEGIQRAVGSGNTSTGTGNFVPEGARYYAYVWK